MAKVKRSILWNIGRRKMNKSKIEWCDHTWNPITGCRHNCNYCYAKRMVVRFAGDIRMNKMAKGDYSTYLSADRSGKLYVLDKPMKNETENRIVYPFGFEPTLHRYRFEMPGKLKTGNNIFVGAMADIFGEWVPNAWIDEVMEVCKNNPIHNYLFLTKNPKRYEQYGVPTGTENLWFGTTITKEEEISSAIYLPAQCKRFVSIEPLIEDIKPKDNQILFSHVDWVIIGAETGNRKNKVVPQFDWIKDIVLAADKAGIPVFMKDSLIGIVGEKNMRREYPRELQKKTVSPKMKRKLYGKCAVCKKDFKKSEMIVLLARSKRGEQPKQFGFMCKECFKKFCKDLGLDIPELIELADSITFEESEE